MTDPIDGQAGPAPRAGGRWELQLLGGLSARNGDLALLFPNRAMALLLARLALAPRSVHPRGELATLLAPLSEDLRGDALETARRHQLQHLRRTLSALKVRLEPAGGPAAAALFADRFEVRLNAEAFDIDVQHFEHCIAVHDGAGARSWYRGELLPGFAGRWIADERDRLRELFDGIDAWTLPPSPLPPPRPSLPFVSPCFGREREIETLSQWLTSSRLISITGAAGCGKTCLSRALADRVAGFDPVLAVPLADSRDAGQALDTLRAALRLQPGGSSPLAQVVSRLTGRRALLLLDDFEHLVGEAAEQLLAPLLAALPGLHLVVTSRRALHRADERELALAPLPLPDAQADMDSAARNPGVALFLHRARSLRADYHLHERNLRAIVAVCRAADGLPLVIELAASQVRERRAHEIGEALERRLGTLVRRGPRAAKAGRHVSLQAALAGSWRLLDPALRAAARSLTVFRGGWTAAQAQALRPDDDMAAALAALADHAWVQRQSGGDGPTRWGMYTAVQQFLREHLPAAEAAACRQAHRALCLAEAERLQARFGLLDDAELPNHAAALASALADGDASFAQRLALTLDSHWSACGASAEVLALLRQTAQAVAPGPSRVPLSCLLAGLLVGAGATDEALRQAETALAECGTDPALRAQALLAHTNVLWLARRDAASASAAANDALQLAQRAGSGTLQGRVWLLLGAATLGLQKDGLDAARCFEEAERRFAAVGDRRASLLALPGRAACLIAQKRHPEVIRVATAGLEQATELGDITLQLQLLNRLGVSHEALRQFDDVLEVCQRQARIAQAHGRDYDLLFAAWNQCRPLARLRRPEWAALLMAFSRTAWESRFGPLDADDEHYVARVRRLVVVQIGAHRWQTLSQQGSALSWVEGLALARGEPPDPDPRN